MFEYEIELKSACGGETRRQPKSLLREASFAARSRLANHHQPFHPGEKEWMGEARSINSARSPGPPMVTPSHPDPPKASAARGQAKRRIF